MILNPIKLSWVDSDCGVYLNILGPINIDPKPSLIQSPTIYSKPKNLRRKQNKTKMEILSPTRTRLKPPLKYFHANLSPPSTSSPFIPHRPPIPLLRKTSSTPRLRSCLAAGPGPAPQSNPPPPNDPIESTGQLF